MSLRSFPGPLLSQTSSSDGAGNIPTWKISLLSSEYPIPGATPINNMTTHSFVFICWIFKGYAPCRRPLKVKLRQRRKEERKKKTQYAEQFSSIVDLIVQQFGWYVFVISGSLLVIWGIIFCHFGVPGAPWHPPRNQEGLGGGLGILF